MRTNRKLTNLEDATLRTLVSCSDESDGWLDLARVCSRVGRHLADVRQAVARLERYGVIEVVATSDQTERWIRVAFPDAE